MCSLSQCFNKLSRLRYPNVPLPFGFSNWTFLRILNFSSEFLFSYPFHCFSVHPPPSLTAQYKSCSSSLCSFVHIPFDPSLFKANISFSLCSSKTFPCLIAGTQTHHQTQFCMPEITFFTNSTCCFQSVSFVWTAVYDIELIRYKLVVYEHKACGIIRKPTFCYHNFK